MSGMDSALLQELDTYLVNEWKKFSIQQGLSQ